MFKDVLVPQGLDMCQAWAFDLAAKEPAASKKCRVYGFRGLGKISPTQGAQIRGERRINRMHDEMGSGDV